MSTSTLFHRTRAIAFMAPVALFALAACGGDDSSGATGATTTVAAVTTTTAGGGGYAVPPTSSTAAPASAAVKVQLATSSLGQIVVDGAGKTLYLFVGDKDGKIGCDTGCIDTWPPLLSDSAVTLGTGLDSEDFGTVARPDGTKQVTFYGHPLYFYRGDQKPGDTNGTGIGDMWYPVDAEGTGVTG